MGVPARSDPAAVRVVSYNVRSLRDGRHRAAHVLAGCAADLACVQEAPRLLRWRPRCAALAREAGLHVVTGGRTAAGLLLLAASRVQVVAAQDVLLTPTRGLHRRGVAVAVVEVAGARLTVASVHLGLRRAERLRHVPEVLAHLDRMASRYDARTVVLAGDVNEPAGGATWRALGRQLEDAYPQAPWAGRDTFPARAPTRRIDGVLFQPAGLRVLRCGVPEVAGADSASDHLPVLADLVPGSG